MACTRDNGVEVSMKWGNWRRVFVFQRFKNSQLRIQVTLLC
jgi:hypothetical protein